MGINKTEGEEPLNIDAWFWDDCKLDQYQKDYILKLNELVDSWTHNKIYTKIKRTIIKNVGDENLTQIVRDLIRSYNSNYINDLDAQKNYERIITADNFRTVFRLNKDNKDKKRAIEINDFTFNLIKYVVDYCEKENKSSSITKELIETLQEVNSNNQSCNYLTKVYTVSEDEKQQFLIREQELEGIKKKLDDKRIAVVSGPRGVGKTTLAQLYVSDYGSQYCYIAWVFVSSPKIESDLVQTFVQNKKAGFVVDENDTLEEQMANLLGYLNSKTEKNSPGLLVIDNANDPQGLSNFLNSTKKFSNWHLLITSYCQLETNNENNSKVLSLINLNNEEALNLIQLKNISRTFNDEDKTLLNKIVEESGFNTLIISWIADMLAYDCYLTVNELHEIIIKRETDFFTKYWISTQTSSSDIEHISKQENTFACLDVLINKMKQNLSDDEWLAIRSLSIFPSDFISSTLLEELLKLKQWQFRALHKQGWLLANLDTHSFKIHEIYSYLLKLVYPLKISEIKTLVSYIDEKLDLEKIDYRIQQYKDLTDYYKIADSILSNFNVEHDISIKYNDKDSLNKLKVYINPTPNQFKKLQIDYDLIYIAKLYNRCAFFKRYIDNNTQLAFDFALKSLTLMLQVNADPVSLARSYSVIASRFDKAPALALELKKKAYELFEQENWKGVSDSYHLSVITNMSIGYRNLVQERNDSNFEESLNWIKKAKEFAEKVKDSCMYRSITVLNSESMLYAKVDDYSTAEPCRLKYLEEWKKYWESFDSNKQIPNLNISIAYSNLAACYRETKQFDKALENYKIALELRKEIWKGADNLGVALLYMAICRTKLLMFDNDNNLDANEKITLLQEAENSFYEGFTIRKKLLPKDDLLFGATFHNLAWIKWSYYSLNNNSDMLRQAKESIDEAYTIRTGSKSIKRSLLQETILLQEKITDQLNSCNRN